MNGLKTHISGWRGVRAVLWAALVLSASAAGGWATQPQTDQAPASTPTAPAAPFSTPLQADRVVVIPINGPIDDWTAVSVERRIREAEEAGADAIVFELDTPGGGVSATLQISTAIKGTSVPHTVAWVHPNAYSGGAIIALACGQIVVGEPAAIGDAFQINPIFDKLGRPVGIRAPTAVERTKILSVINSDVVDSARRNGVDEFLVQAMVIDGVELWLVERGATGEYTAINEEEYRLIFGSAPPRGKPELTGITGGRYEATSDGPQEQWDQPVSESPPIPKTTTPTTPAEEELGEGGVPDTRYIPASRTLEDVAAEFNNPERLDLAIKVPTRRPNFVTMTPDELSEFRLAAYLTDGTSAVVLHGDDAVRFGLARELVRDDEELSQFFGGASLTRSEMSGFEHFARFLSSWPVQYVLIAMLLIGFAIDLLSPGLVLPTIAWVGAIVALLAPSMIVGMAGWWEVAAILIGLGALIAEIFVLPGFGLFGVVGILSLFAGLVGTFIPNGPVLPGDPGTSDGLVLGAGTVLLAIMTAIIGLYFISKRFETFPVLNRLINTSVSGGPREETDHDAMLSAMRETTRDLIAPGDEGVAATPLRPSGNAMINDTLVDVVSDLGYVEKGDAVRVVRVEGMRVVVAKIKATRDDAGGPGLDEPEQGA
ncbi:MAG: membrane-bound ClpP family serine protease [Phycisphaerales bacterium]